MPANAAPMANASSLNLVRSTPIAPAAISSSRIAIQARPIRESRNLMLIKISSADEAPSEQARRCHAVEAGGAIGQVRPVAHHDRHDLAETQRNYGEVVAA